ncbi:KH domain-containing protein [Granulicella tundricola]|uniref:Uncharacterized protein n=1 Tax=Granulicella tundricola (strain ATCC BAA-1859 / DSM 23138 / MP5ACTX9) TaxID=1198114 RepID=E8X1A5_GRATM|nr:KH domain-containing protein [Granulicella tundricola]ADW69059.1 hypothetical protein AciX9_2014 [Granulicella tundricola MP5ACTX9]
MPLSMSELHEVLTEIVRALVKHPNQVVIKVETLPRIMFVISVADEDLDMVIGKQGRTAHSLRMFTLAAGHQMGSTVSLTITN